MTSESDDRQLPAEATAAGSEPIDDIWNRRRTAELVAAGIRKGHAEELAELERRIANWPSGWGGDLVVMLYTDFIPPPAAVEFPDLGITIEPEPVYPPGAKSAFSVLRAKVRIPEKSINGLRDAATRINTLLGALAVLNWGNCGIGWWSFMTHGDSGGGIPKLEPDRVQKVVAQLSAFRPEVARKLQSAMYWIREPRGFLMEERSDVLRVYAGYWNAFECLVEAVCLLRPQPKPSAAEKQASIDALVKARNGTLDAAAISDCYRNIVDPGFVGKASHALRVCFPDRAAQYIDECFRMKPEQDRLYNIRNAINHGDVDADNPSELLRIDDRHRRLWMIVFGMLGLLIPIDRPLEWE